MFLLDFILIYPGVWLIKQPSKLIWKAYNYPGCPANCHFLTACCLQYWLEVVFLMTGQMLSNCVWLVLTRCLEPRFLVNYKSCWPETLQSCLVPLQLSNAPKITEIFNRNSQLRVTGHYISSIWLHSEPPGSICKKKLKKCFFSEPWGLFSTIFAVDCKWGVLSH